MLHDAPDNCRAVLDITVRALRIYLLCQGSLYANRQRTDIMAGPPQLLE